MKKQWDLPYRKPGRVYMVDACQWDFTTKGGKIGHHPNAGSTHPADKVDLVITKEGVDFNNLANTCLFSIAGYFHFHDFNETGVYLMDGINTRTTLESPRVGIMSFEEIGGYVGTKLINPENIFRTDDKSEIWERAFIHMPNMEFGDDLIGLSICGELHWVHGDDDKLGLVRAVNKNTLVFNFTKWGLLAKIWKYSKIFGTKALGLTQYRDDRISVSEVNNEETIKKIFALPQSFVIAVKTKKPITIKKKLVPSLQLPSRYFYPGNKKEDIGFCHEPLVLSDGRYLSYVAIDDRNFISIATDDNMVYPQQLDTINRNNQPYLQEMNVSSRKGVIRKAHFLEMKLKEEG